MLSALLLALAVATTMTRSEAGDVRRSPAPPLLIDASASNATGLRYSVRLRGRELLASSAAALRVYVHGS